VELSRPAQSGLLRPYPQAVALHASLNQDRNQASIVSISCGSLLYVDFREGLGLLTKVFAAWQIVRDAGEKAVVLRRV
jgi:hypothetical protein